LTRGSFNWPSVNREEGRVWDGERGRKIKYVKGKRNRKKAKKPRKKEERIGGKSLQKRKKVLNTCNIYQPPKKEERKEKKG